MKYKYLNEVLLDWNNSSVENDNIISQKDIKEKISSLPYDKWKKKYLTDEIPEEWTFKNRDFQRIFKLKFNMMDIKAFHILYELLEPYTEKVLGISIKMIDKMLWDEGNTTNDPWGPGWWLSTLNFTLCRILFNKSPENFSKDAEKWMYDYYKNNYYNFLTDKERRLLEKIYNKENYLMLCSEMKNLYIDVIAFMPFIKAFGKYNMERTWF